MFSPDCVSVTASCWAIDCTPSDCLTRLMHTRGHHVHSPHLSVWDTTLTAYKGSSKKVETTLSVDTRVVVCSPPAKQAFKLRPAYRRDPAPCRTSQCLEYMLVSLRRAFRPSLFFLSGSPRYRPQESFLRINIYLKSYKRKNID